MSDKKKIYPVEIELTENFLEKNPTIKGFYENGKFNIPISENIPEESAKSITSIVEDLNPRELVLFNPLVEAINSLAEIDNFKETEKPVQEEEESEEAYLLRLKEWEKENDKIFKSANGTIRSFNGSLTKSKKEVKEPYLTISKKIDNLYNFLKDFSDERKKKLGENFSGLISKQEEDKKRKEEEAKKLELEQIKNLQMKNEEANEKLQAAAIKTSYADKVTEITAFYNQQDSKIPSLNENGLLILKEEINQKVFNFENFGDMEQATLESIEKSMRKNILSAIDSAISAGSFENIVSEEQAFVQEKEQPKEPNNDFEVFSNTLIRLNNAKSQIDSIKVDFKDERLAKLKVTLEGQFKLLSDNVQKLIDFTEKKNKIYNELN